MSAEGNGFEVMVTADGNLAYQQNLQNRRLSIVVLPSGNWPKVETRIADVVRAIDESKPGGFKHLKLDRNATIPFKARPRDPSVSGWLRARTVLTLLPP